MIARTRRLALLLGLLLHILVAVVAYRWAYASRNTVDTAISDALARASKWPMFSSW
jgi:hypothetical protein